MYEFPLLTKDQDHYADEAAQQRQKDAVGKTLDCLDARERRIIELRYGLRTMDEPQTLKEIGKELRVSKERVRQLESRALAKLRDAAGRRGLHALVE